jgi:hypothetical protein
MFIAATTAAPKTIRPFMLFWPFAAPVGTVTGGRVLELVAGRELELDALELEDEALEVVEALEEELEALELLEERLLDPPTVTVTVLTEQALVEDARLVVDARLLDEEALVLEDARLLDEEALVLEDEALVLEEDRLLEDEALLVELLARVLLLEARVLLLDARVLDDAGLLVLVGRDATPAQPVLEQVSPGLQYQFVQQTKPTGMQPAPHRTVPDLHSPGPGQALPKGQQRLSWVQYSPLSQ